MTPSKAQRAAEKAVAEWEKQVKDEYEKRFTNPERVKSGRLLKAGQILRFSLLDTWFPICICDGDHKPKTVDFYRHITNKIAEYFKGKSIQQIISTDIKKYIIYLRTKYRTKQGNTLSDKTIRHHYPAFLTLIFSYAMEQEIILKNPMDKVECPKIAKTGRSIDTRASESVYVLLE